MRDENPAKGSKVFNLLNDATRPVRYSERSVGQYSLCMIWFGFAVQLVIFMLAGQLYPSCSVMQVVIALLLGNTVPVFVIFFTQEIGVKFGLTYSVLVRIMFGTKGGVFAGWLRAVAAIFWFGFQTWLCACAVDEVCKMIWTYSNLNLWIVIFGVIQIVTTFYGIKFVKILNIFSSPCLLIMGFILIYFMLTGSNTTLGQVLMMKGNGTGSLAGATMAFIGGYATLACSIQDIVKDCEVPDGDKTNWPKLNLKYCISQWVGMVPASVLFGFMGVMSMALTGEWNPALAIGAAMGEKSVVLAVICEIFIVFATWTTNPGQNLLNPAYVISATFPKVSFKKAVFIAGFIGLVIMPWKMSGNIQSIMNVLGSALGPIAGIIITDYIFIRKRKVALADLYTSKDSGYRYWGGFNWGAILVYAVSVAISLFFPDWMYFVGLVVSAILYVPVMKYWVMKKFPDSLLDYSMNEEWLK